MKLSGRSSSRGASTVACQPTGFSQPTRSLPDRRLPPWTNCWTKPAVVRFTYANWQLQIMIVEAIYYNAHTLCHYALHAFVVMPNHVHLLATPAIALPKLTKSLKGITAKRANAMLALTGSAFWQEEGYDHLVRNTQEFGKIRDYIEGNPVRAGLVMEANEYRWSSAGWPTRGSAADQGVRPSTLDCL
jgi:REP element-mobilizing transposase RayT